MERGHVLFARSSHGEVSVGAGLGHTLLPTLCAVAPGPVAAVFSCSRGAAGRALAFSRLWGVRAAPTPLGEPGACLLL